MATRRTASSRQRSATGTNPMPPPAPATRSRSALGKVTPSTPSSSQEPMPSTSQDAPKSLMPSAPGPLNAFPKPSRNKADSESKIQVVIRCRRRSEREIQDNSPIIVTSSGPKSREVTIETSAPISSLGVVTLPPTRTYPFDMVFGPEADQALIYHDVVTPMLDEVLEGYNCTLFAYGQTGTGKTYTMQGDLEPTPMGNPSPQAGMVPRVLFRLFHYLETKVVDYSVKISYIELYNEELRDLLANDLQAPQGSTQPMGQGARGNSSAPELKIFDDSNKRGVFIQGLEEIPVKDASDALALLTKGSERRQIAATKFNDHSSRSHSVFSITVHIKETSSMGDDLLKIGKLNLVDLAGSENIGRSGAENKRAREAGMINQSLLTLGRVINALVDKAQHVPYRESKLTRLLQDSLGGRTKTCIIATISPARSNMEETLSTLDYALRAKSILNKPELNQRMTRNSLIKEYVAEIERLKADVLAAREKNGIFFSEETWKQLSAEQEMRQTEIVEARKQVEVVECQLRSVREEFEQSIALLTKRDRELTATKLRLKGTEENLKEKEGELKVVKVAFEEEEVMRKAHQTTEVTLHKVAGGLKAVAKQSVGDIGGLFDKLQRTNSVFTSNSKAVKAHCDTINSESGLLSARLEEFVAGLSQNAQKLRMEAKQFQAKELETLGSQSEHINAQLQQVQTALASIQEKDKASSEAIKAAHSIVDDTRNNMKAGFSTWSLSLAKSCEGLCNEVEASSSAGFTAIEGTIAAMSSLVENLAREAQEFVELERASILKAKTLSNDTAEAEIQRLQRQNASLVRLLESEKLKGEQAKNELIGRVSGLLGEFTKARDQSLQEAVGALTESNMEAEEDLGSFVTGLEMIHDEVSRLRSGMSASAARAGVDGKRTRDGALKSLTDSRNTTTSKLSHFQKSSTGMIESYSATAQEQARHASKDFSDAMDRHSRAKRARMEATNSLFGDVQSDYRHLQRSVASTSRNVEAIANRVISEGNALTKIMGAYQEDAQHHISTLADTAGALLQQGAKENSPTGATPRKRVWEYVDHWELTRSREAVLKSWRERGTPEAEAGPRVEKVRNTPLVSNMKEAEENPGMLVDTLSPASEVTESPPPFYSPLPVPLASSASTAESVTVSKRISSLKSSIPAMGTLTDRPTNIVVNRGSRRVR